VSFRARLTLAAAAAVALAIALAAPLIYLAVRNELVGQFESGLRDRADEIAHQHLRSALDEDGNVVVAIPPLRPGEAQGYIQYVTDQGVVRRPASYGPFGDDDVALPVARSPAVAAGRDNVDYSDAHVKGVHLRVVTVPTVLPGLAVQFALPLTGVDDTLARIRKILLAVVLAGIGLAVAFGLLVARAALTPVRRLTHATEHVTATGDLTARLDEGGRDELGRLGASFNQMMEALERSQLAQRQLVANASHELRTPLTSLRTNIEVLGRDRELPAGERERLLSDVVEQLGEMTVLVGELTELAKGEEQREAHEEVRLDVLAAEAARRTRRNHPDVEIDEHLVDTTVVGAPAALERAIGNLLDNAAKWSPPGGTIDLRVADGEVTVRDHGPGISDADLPLVFDRFYRADDARSMPGSGLGLAIVRQVADQHGGTVTAERPDGGGTLLRLRV
jgi:two-component system, OmpR family, sensor histidine kinase MprB